MLDTGKKEPSWVLIVFALGLISVMYVYDRAVAQKTHAARQYGDRNWYRSQFDNPLQECSQASTDDDRRRCADLMAKSRSKFEGEGGSRGLPESKGSSCGPTPAAGSSEISAF